MALNCETMRAAGYKHERFIPSRGHVLRDVATGNLELWMASKNHASYGIVYKNTHLEFVSEFEAHC